MENFVSALIPIVVPMIVSKLKPLLEGSPKRYLPFIAMGLGMIAQSTNSLIVGNTDLMTLLEGAGLGLSGVGLRETLKTRKLRASFIEKG